MAPVVAIGARRRMAFPAQPDVQRQPLAHAVVVLEVQSRTPAGGDVERSVPALRVGARRTEEEIGVRITSVRLGAIIGAGRRVVDAVARLV